MKGRWLWRTERLNFVPVLLLLSCVYERAL